MYDYGVSTLPQYALTPESTFRTRGALLCRTEKGLLILKEFHGSEKKLKVQQELLLHLTRMGNRVDYYLENQEGSLISTDKDGIPYTLQVWYEGRECDTKSREDILKSVRALAKLHKDMKLSQGGDYQVRSLKEEYRRHNQELRKIRKFIRAKGPANTFEKDYLAHVEWFLEKAQEAEKMLEASRYDALREQAIKEGCICHGEYNQHNVLLQKGQMAVTNFGRFGVDTQMADLYCFMRKILEKYNWDIKLASAMLDTYHKEKPITRDEWENLRIRFTYPEKYWKLANHYFSHNKAWISEKNVEKQKNLMKQKEIWGSFPEKCFGTYPYE